MATHVLYSHDRISRIRSHTYNSILAEVVSWNRVRPVPQRNKSYKIMVKVVVTPSYLQQQQ